MNEIQILTSKEISKHNFDKYKNALKRFSEKPDYDFEIPSVETDSFLIFDHKVTGEELNDITERIGEHLIEINKNQNELVKEFKVIYNAFESLDKDYIGGILSSIKSAEIAFNNSVYAINKAVYAIEELQKAQKDIKSTIDIQKKLIKGFVDFQNKLNKNVHLDDIDKIWDKTQLLNSNLDKLKAKINKLEEDKNVIIAKIEKLTECIEYEKKINKNSIEKIVYTIENIQKSINEIKLKQEDFVNKINVFQNKIDKNVHFGDIDNIWKNTHLLMDNFESLNNKIVNLENERNDLLVKNEQLAEIINNKKEESEKLKKLSIGVIILFVLVIVNFVVSTFR